MNSGQTSSMPNITGGNGAVSNVEGMRRLVGAVQELSLARSLPAVMAIVRRVARELTGADGATFVLRDGDKCHYVDEDAIAPLWKGQKFPMSACISGWAMLHKEAVVIPDIYKDPRIPADAYRPTFVKSLVMVPIRVESPIGAIGNYWARERVATAEEVELLKALANTTSVAMENIRVYEELEQRVKDRTVELEAMNRELESFSYSVSHDLRAPLRHVGGYADFLAAECGDKLSPKGARFLSQIREGAAHMGELIEDLLELAQFTRAEVRRSPVDLSAMVRELGARLQADAPERKVELVVQEGLKAQCDARLLRIVLENLLGNAWKYSSKLAEARVEFGAKAVADGPTVYFVKDNGVGFDMRYAKKLFAPFQRLHNQEEFKGTGVGLATVQRIILRHGGRIWVEAAVNGGATFFFTLAPEGPGH